MTNLLNVVLDRIKKKVDEDCLDNNIGTSERILSVISAGLIAGMAVKNMIKYPLTALSALSLSSALVYRGVTGHCTLKGIVDKVSESDTVTVVEHRYFVK